MRRALAIGAATAVAFTAAPAMAGTTTYNGELGDEYGGTVEFKVKKRKGVRKVKAVAVDEIGITCASGTDYTIRYTMDGPAKVKNGAFSMKGGNAVYTVQFEGELNGRSATGTARYYGFTETEEGTQGCDSGHVPWTASR